MDNNRDSVTQRQNKHQRQHLLQKFSVGLSLCRDLMTVGKIQKETKTDLCRVIIFNDIVMYKHQ